MTAYQPRYPLARASTVKAELLCFTIDRPSVMECDPSALLKLLKDVASTRQQVIDHEGSLTFCFAGWDDDPRETAAIPEIRAYFAALTEVFPYWLHYVEKVDDTLMHVLRLLCTGHYEPQSPGWMIWRFDDHQELQQVLATLTRHMTQLHHRHNITYPMHCRITEEIDQLIECTLEYPP